MPITFSRLSLALGTIALATSVAGSVAAEKPKKSDKRAQTPAEAPLPMIGGVAMKRTNTIGQNLSVASNMTTLVDLARLTDLAGVLAGTGQYTVFAPDNAAFALLPPTTITALKEPANKYFLSRILNYHVLAGAFDFAAIKAQIQAGGGTASINTVAGVPLTLQLFAIPSGGETLVLTGANGGKSYVTAADIRQANGIFHVINGVMSPDAPPPPAPQPMPQPAPMATPQPSPTPAR